MSLVSNREVAFVSVSITGCDFLYQSLELISRLYCNTTGSYGLVTSAMYAIGVEMMMGVMVIFEQFPIICFSFSFLNVFLAFSSTFVVVLYRSREHESCGRQPGYVRAHIESKLTKLF